jgi:alkylated DNA nucleotide flippase Atl1
MLTKGDDSLQEASDRRDEMADLSYAIADLARSFGVALTTFAETVCPERPPAAEPATPDLTTLGLGRRQREIAELPSLNSNRGMRASEVAAEIEYDAANTHTALKALRDRGVVEEIRLERGEGPRWRLTPAFRGASDPYVRMVGFVWAGEWTTYGDISIAVRGDTRGARAVGRAAATLPHFPTPHRVLWNGGRVPPTWKSHASTDPNPEECVRRLKDEQVTFDEKGHASRAHYVSWDVLVERSEREG